MDLKFDGIRECLNHWVFELPNVDCTCLYLLYMILEHAIGITDINKPAIDIINQLNPPSMSLFNRTLHLCQSINQTLHHCH